ncbi:tail fiber domain-containing protein [Actinophytocola algeriensis]|jgi:hypothetical protein|uniref:Peptidase S74 domain-containing protein n=1 Tax=Actinophytocola algeriensis TaxID=1768010 RepID=A0A7W7VF88_9PSEU|nr:tail fiber domain-containing protein [Actinophytocola algeriensis]MBB4908052.1 hypothetical protein [Actinophytocola algeriensis]MBE1480082.1 hypothetical protein [Actinophytocola algeriensis]
MTDRTVLARVRELRGVTWDWKADGARGIGVIAQDVEKVFPDAVVTGEDGYLRVDYHGLVGVLVEAVKELAERVEELERRDRP